ncbi:glycoside hydrolase superfamily [Peziza echinospora]|nr:glycoside hydrolase superfamily [Peziza echinospora]
MKFTTSFTTLLLAVSCALALPTAEPDVQTIEKRATISPFAGTNAYWLPFLTNDADVEATFSAVAAAGLKVVRTWAFNDVTSCSGIHFQCWSGSSPTINTGSQGLGRLDVVVRAAEKYGIKLVLPMVNNWGDYGGMDVYVSKLGGSGHSSFYTDAKIIAAYKNYIQTVVNRYKSSSAIYSWQLANEPRCSGCATSVITKWATDISAYIKSLDSSHYVSLGDEGFFNRAGAAEYPYQGSEGVDFEANLKISSLDYGTFHLYTKSWGQSYEWGSKWIKDHGAAGKAAGKSVVLEEYGVPEDGATRETWIKTWHNDIKSAGVDGDQYWQFGLTLSGGKTHDDTYTIFTDESNYNSLVVDWAKSR